MPAKGELYNRVDVDLAKWAKDYMRQEGINQAELARRLGFGEIRVRGSEMVKGKLKTKKYLDAIVDNIYQGDYTAMARYATSQEGKWELEHWNYIKSLKPKELKEHWEALEEIKKMQRKGELSAWLKKMK